MQPYLYQLIPTMPSLESQQVAILKIAIYF